VAICQAGRPGPAGQAALRNDAQQPVGVLLADAPAAQASRASGSRRRSTSTASDNRYAPFLGSDSSPCV
jgi:hypothetical protein